MLETLQYHVSGGQPAVSANLDIGADGIATVSLGTSWSLPPELVDRVGTFAGPMRDAEWSEIERIVAEDGLVDAHLDATPTSPDPSVRVLTLGHDGGTTRLSVTGTDERTAALENRLVSLMRRLVETSPRAALAAKVEATPAAGRLAPRVTLEHVGTEPLPILLFDEHDPSYFARLSFVVERELATGGGPIWLPLHTETLSRDQVAALAGSGVFETGVHAMAPGTAYELSSPPFTMPASDDPLALRARIDLWFPGEGPARRQVTIELARVPLPGPA